MLGLLACLAWLLWREHVVSAEAERRRAAAAATPSAVAAERSAPLPLLLRPRQEQDPPLACLPINSITPHHTTNTPTNKRTTGQDPAPRVVLVQPDRQGRVGRPVGHQVPRGGAVRAAELRRRDDQQLCARRGRGRQVRPRPSRSADTATATDTTELIQQTKKTTHTFLLSHLARSRARNVSFAPLLPSLPPLFPCFPRPKALPAAARSCPVGVRPCKHHAHSLFLELFTAPSTQQGTQPCSKGEIHGI